MKDLPGIFLKMQAWAGKARKSRGGGGGGGGGGVPQATSKSGSMNCLEGYCQNIGSKELRSYSTSVLRTTNYFLESSEQTCLCERVCIHALFA